MRKLISVLGIISMACSASMAGMEDMKAGGGTDFSGAINIRAIGAQLPDPAAAVPEAESVKAGSATGSGETIDIEVLQAQYRKAPVTFIVTAMIQLYDMAMKDLSKYVDMLNSLQHPQAGLDALESSRKSEAEYFKAICTVKDIVVKRFADSPERREFVSILNKLPKQTHARINAYLNFSTALSISPANALHAAQAMADTRGVLDSSFARLSALAKIIEKE